MAWAPTHPTETRSRSEISLSGPNLLYTVVGHRCTCKNFKAQNLCAHSIAAAHSRGELVQFVIGYRAPTVDQLVQLPPHSGKKPGASNRKRIPMSKRTPLDRGYFGRQLEMSIWASHIVVGRRTFLSHLTNGHSRQARNSGMPPAQGSERVHARLLFHIGEKKMVLSIWLSTVKGEGALRAPLFTAPTPNLRWPCHCYPLPNNSFFMGLMTFLPNLFMTAWIPCIYR